MAKILHNSDLHLGPHFMPAADATLKAAQSLEPNAIVTSGDFSQRSEFESARGFIDSLPKVPMLLIPGNHDVPLNRVGERLTKPHCLYCKLICPELNPFDAPEIITPKPFPTVEP